MNVLYICFLIFIIRKSYLLLVMVEIIYLCLEIIVEWIEIVVRKSCKIISIL